MQANVSKDKIFLDVTDSAELAEFFSRKEAGDKVKGRFEASMDEKADGMIVLSIDDIRLEMGKGGKKEDKKADEPTSVKAMKAQQPEEEEEESEAGPDSMSGEMPGEPGASPTGQ